MIPGVQVLFAFLLAVPFSTRFVRVDQFERVVFFVALLFAAFAVVLLLAPSIQHRILFRHEQKRFLVERGNRLAIAGMSGARDLDDAGARAGLALPVRHLGCGDRRRLRRDRVRDDLVRGAAPAAPALAAGRPPPDPAAPWRILRSRDRDPAGDAAARAPRVPRGAHGAVRGMVDAGAVPGRDGGAPGGAARRGRVRRLAHGPLRAHRRERPRRSARRAVERPRRARSGPRAVHAADERDGRHRGRSDRLPAARRVPARRERRESARRPRAPARRDLRRRASSTTRATRRRCSRCRGPRRSRCSRASPRVRSPRRPSRVQLRRGTRGRRRVHGRTHRLHGRGRRRADRPRRRGGARCGTRSSRPAPFRAASARATRCGSRSVTRCTATTSAPTRTRSRRGSAGSARSTGDFTGADVLRETRRRPGAAARGVPHARARDPARRLRDPRRRRRSDRRGHERDDVAEPRRGHRHGLRLGAARRGRDCHRDRRARAAPRRRGRAQAPLLARSRETPHARQKAIPPISPTTRPTTGPASTATPRRSASPGTRRTRSATWSSTCRRTWASR